MRCSSCKRELPAADFSPSEFARGRGRCRTCNREYGREYARRVRATPEGREAAREAKRRRLATPGGREAARVQLRLSRYGLTEEAIAVMLAAQGGRCAICGSTDPGRGSWCVDHDHSCCPGRVTCGGKCIRGLLCQRCNVGLGYFSDDPAILESAICYLNRSTTLVRRAVADAWAKEEADVIAFAKKKKGKKK